jgi:hypothetical protein
LPAPTLERSRLQRVRTNPSASLVVPSRYVLFCSLTQPSDPGHAFHRFIQPPGRDLDAAWVELTERGSAGFQGSGACGGIESGSCVSIRGVETTNPLLSRGSSCLSFRDFSQFSLKRAVMLEPSTAVTVTA